MNVGALLQSRQPALRDWLRQHAGGVLRYEPLEDLAQGVAVRALAAEAAFEWRGEAAAWRWLVTVAQRHVADRWDHWRALRRRSGRVLRITSAPGTRSGVAVAGEGRGPGTMAEAREHLVLAARALGLLPERDQLLVRWHSEGVALAEQAMRLGIAHGAAQRAAHRALERFRKVFALLGRDPHA